MGPQDIISKNYFLSNVLRFLLFNWVKCSQITAKMLLIILCRLNPKIVILNTDKELKTDQYTLQKKND